VRFSGTPRTYDCTEWERHCQRLLFVNIARPVLNPAIFPAYAGATAIVEEAGARGQV
jgi:hypothetical protein